MAPRVIHIFGPFYSIIIVGCSSGLSVIYTQLAFSEIPWFTHSTVSNPEGGTTPGYSHIALHLRPFLWHYYPEKRQQFRPLLIGFYKKFMRCQQNAFGTVQAFV